jgi:hypothetical protein
MIRRYVRRKRWAGISTVRHISSTGIKQEFSTYSLVLLYVLDISFPPPNSFTSESNALYINDSRRDE